MQPASQSFGPGEAGQMVVAQVLGPGQVSGSGAFVHEQALSFGAQGARLIDWAG